MFTRLYYTLKPFLPRPLRIAVRSSWAKWLRRGCEGIWPILQAAARKPEGWPGWPDSVQFALVLTHDVEGPEGLAKVKDLAKLEMSLGFRSSFNLIPEGSYQVDRNLRHWLTGRGFEVGVHDLHHDGKLYRSKAHFQSCANKINHYLKEWNAVGFRSAFMLNNLDWLSSLQVEYDCSSFDTDPFEPQPHGVHTIFPFWVPRSPSPSPDGPRSGIRSPSSPAPGYIELPYTLAQDSTVYLLLRELNPILWKQKVDWVADHGGMVLLNVHPDYIDFSGKSRPNHNTFPISNYIELLNYLKSRYAGKYWHALPKDLAAYARCYKPVRPPLSNKRIGMLSYSFYECDNRVRRYCETLADRGDQVEVFAIGRDKDTPRREIISGVTVRRLQNRKRDEKGAMAYASRLLRFFTVSSLAISARFLRRRYDLIHVHNVPDFLVFSCWLAKLAGCPIILDIHDILPEFYANKFSKSPQSFGVRFLKVLERFSARFADHVIISNHLWYEKFTNRSVPSTKCSVVMNHVDDHIFSRRSDHQQNGAPHIVFPGGLQWHQGLDIAIKAMPLLRRHIPNAELHVYGDGDQKNALVDLIAKLELGHCVHLHDTVPLHEVPQILAGADLGIVPKRADSFGNEAYSTKIMEFMAMGLPVVASETKIDTFYFGNGLVHFFKSGDAQDMARAMQEILQNHHHRRQLIDQGLVYVQQNNWSAKKHDYLALVDSLANAQ